MCASSMCIPCPGTCGCAHSATVIELPITGDLDINGWELRKALGLLGKGNATLIEWLDSPIVYRADAVFLQRLRALAELSISHSGRFITTCTWRVAITGTF